MTVRRRMSDSRRARVFEAHAGRCHICGTKILTKRWEVEHIIPIAMGGDDEEWNMAPAHFECHRPKTKVDKGRIAKMKRQHIRHIGAHRSRRPMPGGRGDKWKRKVGGRTVLR